MNTNKLFSFLGLPVEAINHFQLAAEVLLTEVVEHSSIY